MKAPATQWWRLVAPAGLLLCGLTCTGCGGTRRLDTGAASGEMVMYGATARIRGFDPVKAGDVASAMAISKIYEGLLQYSYLVRPYRVEPLLADGMPEVSADGLVYTFHIRPGIYFQDDPCFTNTAGRGRELTAADFVYSIKRVADAKNASTGYWAFRNRIVGLDEFRKASQGQESTDYDLPVEGLRALDRYTLQIKLVEPYPQLLWVLTMQYAFAVPREAVEYYGESFLNHPVGTGPYVLKAWRRNYRVEFERNPKWSETGRKETYPREGAAGDAAAGLLEDAGRPVPFIDRIVQFVVSDDSTRWLMFLTGEFSTSGISRDNWDAVITESRKLDRKLEEMGIVLAKTPTLSIYYLGFNMDDPVVGGNRKLRQAMTCAFNTEEWIHFYNDRIKRPTGPIPPGVAGYEERPALFPYDLERARRLLAEAGYPGGRDPRTGRRLELTLDLGQAQSPEMRQSTELFADFMTRIGIVIKPSYNNWPTFLGKLERRQVQMYRLGWVADYPDAENFLQLFYGPNSSPGPNHSNYSNPEFDRLYERARVMPDCPERTRLYARMARMIEEDCPWIFTSIPLDYVLRHSWLRNYKPHDFPYGMVKYLRIDAAARRAWKMRFGG